MAEIHSVATFHGARSYRPVRAQAWRQAVPQIAVLVALSMLSAAAAIAYPLTFSGVFSAL